MSTALVSGASGADPIAPRLAAVVEPIVGELPVRLRAWDGSSAGPEDAPEVVISSPDALRRMLWHPGELGAAQAYVTGEADLPGDLDETLSLLLSVGQTVGRPSLKASATALARLTGLARELRLVGAPPAAPVTQARVRGRLHSQARDRESIHHHYDLSTDFYALILDPSMAYSCGYYADETTTLEQAQHAKLSLICTKLGLEAGSTLLDVGCGWGSLAIHAARHFGARVVGLTIAAEQQRFVQERVRAEGLEHLVEVRLCDYRDATGHYDAVASVEMGEHVGERNYPTYAAVLARSVRPGGRVLVQQMSRRGRRPGGGAFIESFIAPDMHMRPVGETVGYLERAGLEVRDVHALREHYVRTVAGWIERFESNLDAITALVGPEMVRVWRLYLVGGSAAFRDGRMGVDQILAVRPGAAHTLPARREW
ncbi:cyclopropane-fatty-acyl-phospholipid synthase [Nocardioides sp. BP30]|uniref:cyclopropane-fatty-acyl-phospholipid synthase family protein n=1 Tax=Nocardioides sp. BP30 TaxID=3036374 RepID=UPI0024691305|nr:cyclopropane-fatty-acyl-phospholipid synthase family protein [Nocardioides sp. BP30]WGL51170.1 cyclopropane-fatty-acyl-phospholipid synthase [Nocardioides sp. BP30]